jgi:hypothetical protein
LYYTFVNPKILDILIQTINLMIMKVIDLFPGIGGLSACFQNAGFEIVAASFLVPTRRRGNPFFWFSGSHAPAWEPILDAPASLI